MVSKRGDSNLIKCDIGQCLFIVFIPCLCVLWCIAVLFENLNFYFMKTAFLPVYGNIADVYKI